MKTKWKEPAVPRTVIQMIPVDLRGTMLMLHRSNAVRSARNVWSFPSGLHEIGQYLEAEAERELGEEFGLKAIDGRTLGVYENIGGDTDAEEQYHWVIVLVVILVEDVERAINREPDKHDQIKYGTYLNLASDAFWAEHPFHASFSDYMNTCGSRERIAIGIGEFLREARAQCQKI